MPTSPYSADTGPRLHDCDQLYADASAQRALPAYPGRAQGWHVALTSLESIAVVCDCDIQNKMSPDIMSHARGSTE